MRLEWIDDILAVLDTGSLTRAAEKRFLSQSAFTRRMRMIEQSIGTTLFDRRRKPVTLLPGVEALAPEMRDLSSRLHKLHHALTTSADQAGKSYAIVCQHALTTTVSPRIVRALTADGETSVRVRSGNQDDCLMQLVSGLVDFAVMYTVHGEPTPVTGNAFEAVTLGTDMLVPVCAPAMRGMAEGAVIPAITYPSDVFLGQVFDRRIAPRLPEGVSTTSVAETALTLAMMQFALTEIGIAWLPQSLVAEPLARGQLVRVDDVLPTQDLDITAIRLSGVPDVQADAVWTDLTERLRFSEGHGQAASAGTSPRNGLA